MPPDPPEAGTSAERPPERVEAAVLVPVFRDDAGALRLVLVRRTEHGRHGGQLAFPGGMREPGDPSPDHTALREAEEEIGLAPGSVQILARLPAIETRTTGFRITPFLARIARPERWRPDPREVAEVIEVGVSELLAPEAQGLAVEQFPGWPGPQTISFLRVGPHRLWGATHRILSPLLPRLAAGEWAL